MLNMYLLAEGRIDKIYQTIEYPGLSIKTTYSNTALFSFGYLCISFGN